jgi:hypothetical protein
MSPITVRVDRSQRGEWEIALSDRSDRVRCPTLTDAKRAAYQYAARRHPCELVVRDAYHRVLHRALIDGDADDAVRDVRVVFEKP